MSTGYPITKQPCTIHGVMPSYLQEVEKEISDAEVWTKNMRRKKQY